MQRVRDSVLNATATSLPLRDSKWKESSLADNIHFVQMTEMCENISQTKP